jgi:hypothetical protein
MIDWSYRHVCKNVVEATALLADVVKRNAQSIKNVTDSHSYLTLIEEMREFSNFWNIPFDESALREMAARYLTDQSSWQESEESWYSSGQYC